MIFPNRNRIGALMLKSWYITIQRMDRMFDVFYWPLIGLFMWGFTTIYLREVVTDNKFIDFLLGGAILWIFFQRAMHDIALYVLEDFWSNNLYNLFASPIKSVELAISTILFGLVRALIAFFYLTILAIVMYQYNIFDLGIFPLIVISLGLLIFGWSLGMIVAGLIFRHGQSIQVFAWSTSALLQPFSAVFYPLASLPAWAKPIASLLPASHIFEGMRAALVGQPIGPHMIKAFGLNAVFLLFAGWFFVRSIEKAREKGILTKSD